MSLWSRLMGRNEAFVFSNLPQSLQLRKILEEASSMPLSDLTWRIVIASTRRSQVFDITLFKADALLTAYEHRGINMVQLNAASIVRDAISGAIIDDGTLTCACLAFFDTDFTVGSNKGKTDETAWNTLALDAECKDGNLHITRSAHRLTFPVGSVSLDLDGALKLFQ